MEQERLGAAIDFSAAAHKGKGMLAVSTACLQNKRMILGVHHEWEMKLAVGFFTSRECSWPLPLTGRNQTSSGTLAMWRKAVCIRIQTGVHTFCMTHNRLLQLKASQGNTFHYTGKVEKNNKVVHNSSSLTPATDAIKKASLLGKMKIRSLHRPFVVCKYV